MSLLADLKAKVAAERVSASANMTAYLNELEAAAKANKLAFIVIGVVCLVVGGVIGHAI